MPALARRFGNKGLLLVGLLLGVAGPLWSGLAGADARHWVLVAPPMLLIGFGQGLLLAPLTAAGVAGVTRDDAGAASGMVDVAHQLGGALGLGLLVLVFASAAPSAAQARPETRAPDFRGHGCGRLVARPGPRRVLFLIALPHRGAPSKPRVALS